MLLLVVLYFFVCIERINSRNGRMSKKELLFFLFVLAAGGVMAQQYRERGDFDRGGYRKFFGRNIFASRNLSFEPNLNIPTPENYRLGPGDEVIINVWGTSENTVRETISPEGNIMVENIGPIYLSGMNMEEAERYLRHEFNNSRNISCRIRI